MSGSGETDDAALREELSTFGLSDTEIDAYLTILSQGETTTRQVSETADVTQRAVYNIAERLEDRGLVVVNDHASPTTIRATPPGEAIAALSQRLEAIQPTLEERFTESEQQAPEIQIVKSRETALKRLQTAIETAEHEVVVTVPEDVLPEIEPGLRAAREDGVLVFLLIGEMDEPDRDPEAYGELADVVRYWDESLPFVYAVDDEASMIGDRELLGGTHDEDDDAVFVDETNLAGSIFGLYLGAYWPAATELYVTDPDPLPKSYDWFRTAVLHGVLHRQKGIELRAEVETDDGEHVSGIVSQVRQPFVEPPTNEFTLETSLYLETDDGEVTVGGNGSFLEDYEAEAVTLLPATEPADD